MGQKSHPIALRLKINRSFDSCWYNDYNYAQCVSRDLLVEKYLESVFKKRINGPTSRVFMREVAKKLTVTAFFHNAKRTRLNRMKRLSDKPFFIKRKIKKVFYSPVTANKSRLPLRSSPRMGNPSLHLDKVLGRKAVLPTLRSGGETKLRFRHQARSGRGEACFTTPTKVAGQPRYEVRGQHRNVTPIVSPRLGNLFASRCMLIQSRVAQLENKKWLQIPVMSIPRSTVLLDPRALAKGLQARSLLRYSSQGYREHSGPQAFKPVFTSNQAKIKAQGHPFITHVEKLVSLAAPETGLNRLGAGPKGPQQNMVHFHPYVVTSEFQSAQFLAEEIVYYLGRGINFRQIKNQILKEIRPQNNRRFNYAKIIKGLRISCSGRLGGRSKKAQRSRTLSARYGSVPLHVFSNKIDYAFKLANTRFGSMGIKVWVCYK